MYTNLAGYFDEMFPVGDLQLRFINEELQRIQGRDILDASCGSGGYTLALSQAGYLVTGIDMDPGKIAYAREKAYQHDAGVHFRIEDLRCINEEDRRFSAVLCLGNSLTHLLTDEDIEKALMEVYRVLIPGGIFILQMINYDHVLRYKPAALPVLELVESGTTFSRTYGYREDGLIDFTTCLRIQQGDISNDYGGTIPLRPIAYSELQAWLAKIGFSKPTFYGGFDRSAYSEESMHTVLTAFK